MRGGRVKVNPAEYTKLHTIRDVLSFPKDEAMKDEPLDETCKYPRLSQFHGNIRRLLQCHGSEAFPSEPQVILINAAPQGEVSCQCCCCVCHHSRCMYKNAEKYPLLREGAHISRDSISSSSDSKKSYKHITYNIEPQICREEGGRSKDVEKPISTHMTEEQSIETKDVTSQPAQ